MDSGNNSESLHSSSGGDEEYDSRAAAADSVSAFMSGGGGPVSNIPPPLFDPLSNYLQLQQNPNSSSSSLFLNHPNMAWPRSDPNPVTHDTINPMPYFQTPAAPPLHNQNQNQSQNHNQTTTAARNPKKRSRASRRAPTTVLTTDTTNFRAMVQEFTGIPAPPFSNNSSFPIRSRFDLFGTRSATAVDSAQPPPYLRRPFAQKVQPPPLPFLSSSTNNSFTSASSNNTIAASTSSNPFNIQNPLLTSLLQSSNTKFPFSTTSNVMNSKFQGRSFQIPSNNDDHEQLFGLGQRNDHLSSTLSGLPNLVPSDQIHNDDINRNNNAAIWSNNNPVSPDMDKDDRINLNGSYNFSASSTNFQGGKLPENVSAAAGRGEGMVESWICSSE